MVKARRPLHDLDERIASLRESRARLPELVRNRYASRHRRAVLGHDSRLLLVTTDDLAGHVVERDRADLLRRLTIALDSPGVDGVVSTADVLDDLLMLEALDDRVVLGAMGALPGAGAGPGTGYDAVAIAGSHLEGGAIECVVDPPEASTLPSCARAVTDLAAGALLCLLRPSSPSRGVVHAAVVAAGLGSRSAFTWLAVPADAELDAVLAATTLPVLLVVDDQLDDRDLATALDRPGVRGVVVGRRMLCPGDDDVDAAVDRLARIVHPTGPWAQADAGT